MAAFITSLKNCQQTRGFPFGQVSELIADGGAIELDRWRAKLGLKASWKKRSPTGVDCYTLPPEKHRAAIKEGAALLSDREFLTKIRELRGDIDPP